MMRLICVAFACLLIVACKPTAVPEAVAKDTLTIGLLTPLSGTSAVYGQAALEGAQKSAAEHSSAALQVTIIAEDTKNDPKEAVVAYQRLLLQDPDIIISTFSAPSTAVAPLALQDGMPIFYTITFADLQKDNPNAFRYYTSTTEEAKSAVQAFSTLGLQKIALLYLNIEGSLVVIKAAEEEFPKNNLTIVAKESFALGETDMSVQVQKLLASKPDAIYIVALRPDQALPVVRKQTSLPVLSYSGASVTGIYKIDAFNDTYTVAPSYFIAGSERNAEFRRKFPHENGYAAYAYDSLSIIVEGHKNNPEDIIAGIASVEEFDLFTSPAVVDKERRFIDVAMYPFVIRGGTLEVLS